MTNPLLGPAKSPLVSMTWTGADFWQYLQIRVRAVDRLRVKLVPNAIKQSVKRPPPLSTMPNQASNQLIDKTELWTQEELLALWPRSGSRNGQDDSQTGPDSLGATGIQIDSRLVKLGIFSFLYRRHGHSETVTILLRAQ